MTWRFFCRINDKAWGLNPRQIISSADLGGSSNYSKETFSFVQLWRLKWRKFSWQRQSLMS